jgi:hypothetical protein
MVETVTTLGFCPLEKRDKQEFHRSIFNFMTQGVLEGRRVFGNIIKYLVKNPSLLKQEYALMGQSHFERCT